MKTISTLFQNKKTKSLILPLKLFSICLLFSSCDLFFEISHGSGSFYEGRWEIYAMVSNITGMEYECYGIIDIETAYGETNYYMDLYDWPYYADYGTISNDRMYLEGHHYYASLNYKHRRLIINTGPAGYELSFKARPL